MDFNYVCTQCGKTFDIDPGLMVCPVCSAGQRADRPLAGVLEVELKPGPGETFGPDFDVFDLLPVPRVFFPPIPVGDTPLWAPANLRSELNLPGLYIKDDGANPTNSLKDRASYLVSAFAAQHGVKEIVLASTGNAGSSMAGVGAAAGQRITLFLPRAAPKAKLVQALQYGARVLRVEGSYDDAYDLSSAYSAKHGGMSRNTAYNPMTLEGKKTAALEIFQQLGRTPDVVFVATGDGCILSGLYKGFSDLKKLGLADRIPALVSVQAEGSDALHRAWKGEGWRAGPSQTVADSISVDVPRNGLHALEKLKEHGGRVMTVSDEEIIAAQARLSRTSGLFTEPAGAAAMAGLLKAAPEMDPESTIVVLATGNGLKDVSTAGRGVDVPEKTIKSLEDI